MSEKSQNQTIDPNKASNLAAIARAKGVALAWRSQANWKCHDAWNLVASNGGETEEVIALRREANIYNECAHQIEQALSAFKP